MEHRPKVYGGCHTATAFARLVVVTAVLVLSSLVGVVGVLAEGGSAGRLELIMVEEAGCPYCMAWHRQVGPGYAKSYEGRRAPLRSVDVKSSAAKALGRIIYTPTFVLVRQGGGEVGRILGYPGEELFWGQITQLVAKADHEPAALVDQSAGVATLVHAAGNVGLRPE